MAHPDLLPVLESNQIQTHADCERYKQLYQQSIQEPNAFWRKHGQRISWFKPYQKVKNTSFEPGNISICWFEDGSLNACYNCLDRHLPSKANEPAYFWEGDSPGTAAVITYGELHSQVCRLANGLSSLGVKKGSRVTIYLPMIVEAVVAMLACARIGAVHSVVFAGFSPEALANRIHDSSLIEQEIVLLQEQGALIIDGLSTGIDLVSFFPMMRHSTEEFVETYRVYVQGRQGTLPFETLEELVASGLMLDRLKDSYMRYVEAGSTEFDPAYLARLTNRENLTKILVDLMDKHELDALVYPFKSLPAPPLGTGDRGVRDNPVSASTGLPALVVPAGVNNEGLPISIEFLGRPFSEEVLFRLGYAYEQATNHRMVPTLTPALQGEHIQIP
jgi:hypothetical protein